MEFFMSKRDRFIKIRVNENEYQTLVEKKEIPELTTWIRETMLNISEADLAKLTKPKKIKYNFPSDVVRQLAGVGNNLNQIARHLNTRKGEEIDLIEVMVQLQKTENALNILRGYIR